jgi:hypothetical protein
VLFNFIYFFFFFLVSTAVVKCGTSAYRSGKTFRHQLRNRREPTADFCCFSPCALKFVRWNSQLSTWVRRPLHGCTLTQIIVRERSLRVTTIEWLHVGVFEYVHVSLQRICRHFISSHKFHTHTHPTPYRSTVRVRYELNEQIGTWKKSYISVWFIFTDFHCPANDVFQSASIEYVQILL